MQTIPLSIFDIKQLNAVEGNKINIALDKQRGKQSTDFELMNSVISNIHWGSTNDPIFFVKANEKYRGKILPIHEKKVENLYTSGELVDLGFHGQVQIKTYRVVFLLCDNRQDIIYNMSFTDNRKKFGGFWMTQTTLQSLIRKSIDYDSKYSGKATMATIRIKKDDG